MKVELRKRGDGTWYARVVHGPRTYARISISREAALRQVLRGVRYCLRGLNQA